MSKKRNGMKQRKKLYFLAFCLVLKKEVNSSTLISSGLGEGLTDGG